MLQESTTEIKKNLYCPKCGVEMKYKDTRKRMYMKLGGKRCHAYVERYYCKECHVCRGDLPDFLIPNKRYEKVVIEKVLSGEITNESYISLYGPSPITINRWLKSSSNI